MAYAKKSPEDRKAEMQALHERLTAQVETLRNSEGWTAYLTYCQAFHHYSLNNLMLIYAQYPEASRVAGYQTWQKLGRQVRKGEHGIRIFGTGTVKVRDNEEAGEDARRRIFFPVSVFDLAQTDLIPGHAEPSNGTCQLDGADPDDILGTVERVLTARGITFVREVIPGSANGYSRPPAAPGDPIRVVVDSELSPAQAAKTALHEAAHVLAGHLDDDYSEYLAHRGRYEVEAESIAYVVAGLLGMDTSAYSTGYVAHWAERADSDVLRETAARVLATVHVLADLLTAVPESVAA